MAVTETPLVAVMQKGLVGTTTEELGAGQVGAKEEVEEGHKNVTEKARIARGSKGKETGLEEAGETLDRRQGGPTVPAVMVISL